MFKRVCGRWLLSRACEMRQHTLVIVQIRNEFWHREGREVEHGADGSIRPEESGLLQLRLGLGWTHLPCPPSSFPPPQRSPQISANEGFLSANMGPFSFTLFRSRPAWSELAD